MVEFVLGVFACIELFACEDNRKAQSELSTWLVIDHIDLAMHGLRNLVYEGKTNTGTNRVTSQFIFSSIKEGEDFF